MAGRQVISALPPARPPSQDATIHLRSELDAGCVTSQLAAAVVAPIERGSGPGVTRQKAVANPVEAPTKSPLRSLPFQKFVRG